MAGEMGGERPEKMHNRPIGVSAEEFSRLQNGEQIMVDRIRNEQIGDMVTVFSESEETDGMRAQVVDKKQQRGNPLPPRRNAQPRPVPRQFPHVAGAGQPVSAAILILKRPPHILGRIPTGT